MMRFVLLIFTLLPGLGGAVNYVGRERDNVLSSGAGTKKSNSYEIWASDQSNSVQNAPGIGSEGGFMWIWDSKGIKELIETGIQPEPLPCYPDQTVGPCDVLHVFPQSLLEYSDNTTPTSSDLGDLDGFGRLHGMRKDPTERYVTVSLFAPGGGYIGVIDTLTKEAIGLFRATQFRYMGEASPQRSNHMSNFSRDGKYIIVSNLDGKAMERIDVTRDRQGIITQLTYNKSATLGLGKNMVVNAPATFFKGQNAFGNDLVGGITGDYTVLGLSNFTPNGVCKENGCGTANQNGSAGGRPNNRIICPISSDGGLAYITMAGGGLLIAQIAQTPMKVVGEYGNAVVYGAGCGGVQHLDGQMFMNAGVSAGTTGATQSMFAIFAFDDSKYPLPNRQYNLQNEPMPTLVFQDKGNTATLGNVEGLTENTTGQKPFSTTRRDAHGMIPTIDGKYIHAVDRIQNLIEVLDTKTYTMTSYDLVSTTGKNGRQGPAGVCYRRSVLDDPLLALNDPAPDLMDITPDGKYLAIAFRGPVPVSVSHSSQGSCPGVGLVEVLENGKSGKLVEVLRTTNALDNTPSIAIAGGTNYAGAERSDIHGAIAISRQI